MSQQIYPSLVTRIKALTADIVGIRVKREDGFVSLPMVIGTFRV